MFIVVLSAVLGLMHLYVWKRLVKDTTRPGRIRWALSGVLAALAALLIAALALPEIVGETRSAWFAWPGFLWFALIAYLFLTLLVLEPVRLALRRWTRPTSKVATDTDDPTPDVGPVAPTSVNRRMFLARASAVAAGAASVGLVGVGTANALGPPNVLHVPVRLRKLDPALRGFRIAVVSDIHLGPLAGRAHTERIVRMINETTPDLVAIVGDLVDGTVAELGPAAEPLRDLHSREGSFFVTGNHEYFSGFREWITEVESFGLTVLRNQRVEIDGIDLAGVNDITGGAYGDGPDYGRALADRDVAKPVVLMAHQPIQVTEAQRHGVDLQLSGHTHGGQIFPFSYLVRLQQPVIAGYARFGDTQLYVTRGAGFWGPPVRVGAPPDITLIELRSA